jgi:hypothetical protein
MRILTASDIFWRLVHTRRWSLLRYENWLGDTLCEQRTPHRDRMRAVAGQELEANMQGSADVVAGSVRRGGAIAPVWAVMSTRSRPKPTLALVGRQRECEALAGLLED